MQKFEYKVLKNEKLITGEMEARDEDEVVSKLKEKGYEILSIGGGEERKSTGGKKKGFKIPLIGGGNKIKKVDKLFLFKNLATMIKAGLPLPETIDLLRESINNDKVKEVLSTLKYDVEAGGTISGSLSKFKESFGTSEIAMINAGEVGGTLPQSFQNLFEDVESEHELQKDIKSAMMYPAIVLSILMIVGLLMMLFVLPQMTGFFEQANIEVPTITKYVIAFSKFTKQYSVYIAILLVGLIFGLRIGVRRSVNMKKTIEKIVFKIPIVGAQIRSFYVYKFARMLGLLIKSGVPILEALEIVSRSLSHMGYRHSVDVMRKDVKVGGKLFESVGKFQKLYPPFVSRMLQVGDRTGNTSDSLENISEYYRQELEETLKNLSSLIEPIMMVFLGAGVALIAISVLIPLYSMVSGINEMQK